VFGSLAGKQHFSPTAASTRELQRSDIEFNSGALAARDMLSLQGSHTLGRMYFKLSLSILFSLAQHLPVHKLE